MPHVHVRRSNVTSATLQIQSLEEISEAKAEPRTQDLAQTQVCESDPCAKFGIYR
jgi:hypothetical protein